MKPNDTESQPNEAPPQYKDPFLEAIARNPRPLSMVVIGIIGMPLMLWLTAPEGKGTSEEPPVFERGAQPIDRTLPELFEAEPETSATPLESAPADPLSVTPSPLDTLPFFENGAALLPDPVVNTPAISPERPSIALIIDDIGYNSALGEQAIALPGNVTYAVLPFTPHGAELAELANQHGKEVMLHAPMSNLANMPLGPGALTPDLDKDTFVETLNEDIDAVPYLQGINNHMGSALTEMETPMRWVMEVLKERQLYFVDSYTTANSVAGKIALEEAIPTMTRNVFLDNVQSHEDIDREFKKLIKLAKEKGVAVGIGHPYKETLLYLEQALPLLEQEGVDLISASKMIRLQQSATDAW